LRAFVVLSLMSPDGDVELEAAMREAMRAIDVPAHRDARFLADGYARGCNRSSPLYAWEIRRKSSLVCVPARRRSAPDFAAGGLS
jgi:hypothetical protein